MPSLWTTPLGQHIVASSCPGFDNDSIDRACEARLDALRRIALTDQIRSLRARVGYQWACNMQEPMWDASFVPCTLFPDPPALNEHPEVQRLRNVLPPELLRPINASGLSLNGQLVMAQTLEQHLDDYRSELARAGDPYFAHPLRLHQAATLAKAQGYPPPSKPDSTPSTLSVTPTSLFNTLTTRPRYFRILAWNLENFTRDRRPRGSAPIDSLRNQARVAIVVELMRALEIDLLLVMETGYDVGPAMTAIASRLEQSRTAAHGVHALVSPPTGALPSVRRHYPKVKLGRRTASKALALRTLFEVYQVKSLGAQRSVTPEQLATAWSLLREHAPGLPELGPEQLAVVGRSGAVFPRPEVFRELRGLLGNDYFARLQLDSDAPDLIYTLAGDAADLIQYYWLPAANFDLQNPTLAEMYDDIIDGVSLLREFIAEQEPRLIGEARGMLGGLLTLEVLLTFTLQALAGGVPEDEKGWVFGSASLEGESGFGLAIYLMASSAELDFAAIDKAAGPLNGSVDNDVVLDALQRLGIVERHIETYGMVYVPPFAEALGRLFELGVREHGYRGELDEQASAYDIVRAPLSGGDYSIQERGGLLNWRSALQLTVPVSWTINVPIALFHTRYSGTKLITETYGHRGLNKAEATVKARVDSVVLLAQAALPGHSLHGLPLIVGDFNIPQDYLEPDNSNSAPVLRKQGVRGELLQGMANCGYRRHTTTGRIGEGHALTTLKAFKSLALGEGRGSQPYDGVYEPFDFAQRGVVVRSGVVEIDAIITNGALQAQIQGILVDTPESVDLEDEESDEVNDEVNDEVIDDNQRTGTFTSTVVIEAVAIEITRIYVGCMRRLLKQLETLDEWMRHLEQRANRGARSRNSRYACGQPSPELLDYARQIRELAQQQLPNHIAERERWFKELCVNFQYVDFVTATRQADFLEAQRPLFLNAGQEANRCGNPSKSLSGLPDLLTEIQTQLRNLETNSAIRAVVAYRAIVSDHLPQVIELDLEPG